MLARPVRPHVVRRLATCALVLAPAALAVTGCTPDEGPAPVRPAPPPFDCEAVAAAAAALDARGPAELQRLGLAADDPQALTVTIVAAGTGAPAYWSAVRDALTDDAPRSLVTDVGVVRGYWAALEPDLAAVTVADASPTAVQAAGARLSAVADGASDDALAPAQKRVEDAVAATCG